jgi:hypothetical protein
VLTALAYVLMALSIRHGKRSLSLPGRTRPSYCFSKRCVPIEGIF